MLRKVNFEFILICEQHSEGSCKYYVLERLNMKFFTFKSSNEDMTPLSLREAASLADNLAIHFQVSCYSFFMGPYFRNRFCNLGFAFF